MIVVEGVGVERGPVVGVGADVHQDNLPRLQLREDPVRHGLRRDSAAGALPAEGVHGPADRQIAEAVYGGDGPGIAFAERKPEQRPGIPAGRLNGLLRPDDLLPDRASGESGESRMRHRMVAHAGARRPQSRRLPPGWRWPSCRSGRTCRARRWPSQRLEDAGQPGRVGPGVERQCHNLAGAGDDFEVAAGERCGKRRCGRDRGGGWWGGRQCRRNG